MDCIDRYLIYTEVAKALSGSQSPYKNISVSPIEPQSHHFDYLEREHIPHEATKFTIVVTEPRDLTRQLIKSDSAFFFIPEIKFESPSGTGKYFTVEGVLEYVQSILDKSESFLPSTGPGREEMDRHMSVLQELKSVKRPFSLVLYDPLSGSEVEKWESDEITGKLTVRTQRRTWDENEEYGLLKSKSEAGADFYTGEEAIRKLAEQIMKSKNIVGLTGAGISTESGIPAYRNIEGDGVWSIYNIEDDQIENFLSKEKTRINFWAMRKKMNEYISAAQPNPAHLLFKRINDENKLSTLITQNVDGLHARAGVPAEKIVEIHGSVIRSRCIDKCGYEVPSNDLYKLMDETGVQVPSCPKCGGYMHTCTVSYGVALDPVLVNRCKDVLSNDVKEGGCDLLIVIGSSLVVQPVSRFPTLCMQRNSPVAIINVGGTKYDEYADFLLEEKAGVVCKKICEEMDKIARERGEREAGAL